MLFFTNQQKRCSGAELLHQVFDYLNLAEREFFGIQIIPHHHHEEFVVNMEQKKTYMNTQTE